LINQLLGFAKSSWRCYC